MILQFDVVRSKKEDYLEGSITSLYKLLMKPSGNLKVVVRSTIFDFLK